MHTRSNFSPFSLQPEVLSLTESALSLDSIAFGQKRQLLVELTTSDGAQPVSSGDIQAQLSYCNANRRIVSSAAVVVRSSLMQLARSLSFSRALSLALSGLPREALGQLAQVRMGASLCDGFARDASVVPPIADTRLHRSLGAQSPQASTESIPTIVRLEFVDLLARIIGG